MKYTSGPSGAAVARAKHMSAPTFDADTKPAVLADSIPLDAISEYEKIARLAYSYWEAGGWQSGSAEEDWLRAEKEIRNQQDHSENPH